MKKISTYIWEHKFAFAFAILSMVISISLDMLSPQLTKHIVDDVIINAQIQKLTPLLLGILGIGIGRCIFQYTKEYTFDAVGSKISAQIRKDLFLHIQSLSADFFDRTGTGELMSRVKDDVDRIWDGLTFVGMLLIEVFIHTTIVLFCMYRLNWKLAILPTIGMAVSAFIAIYMERKLDVVYEEISEENASLNTVAEENLAGVRTVKAFAREKHEISKFLSHNQRYYDLNMQQSKLFVKYHPYISLITRILPLSVLFIGGFLVNQKEMTLGDLSAFIDYSMNIVWPMEMLGWLTNSFSAALASNRRIKKVYAQKPSITEPENPVILPKVKGKITFSNVSFHKADLHEILHDISFTVEPGKTIGIMGATGAGKSSLIYLLQRLYDTTDGAIYLDDVNIKDLSLKQLRSSISLVMQDVFLFSDTILENVKLGQKKKLTLSSVMEAADRAQAKSFIEKMDKKYDTVIGERGIGLSGGQKQRITIARALAKKAPVLVLDDSTSALDMETEQFIHETLRTLPDTTKIIIGHRISAVCHADEIIILDNGRIAERGDHKSLLAQKGLYYRTYVAQYGTPKEEITA
ncbi:MAG: ABC transporter ATP-binding protein [Lachnospiraceae bacterium]|nr:ABC transporter ATP-binding protein [Lachnospiraceae bacterium]MDY5870140.1 ABC transporter ATP-binding protein [Lachnospiraceae bacterium]